MPLDDAGFDASVLSAFRTRLLAHDAGTRLLDLVLTRCRERGWLKAGGTQRTDLTATALNLVRILNWRAGVPVARTRRSRFRELLDSQAVVG